MDSTGVEPGNLQGCPRQISFSDLWSAHHVKQNQYNSLSGQVIPVLNWKRSATVVY